MTAAEDYFLDDEDTPAYDAPPEELAPEELEALERANWHLRHVARLRREADELRANVEAEVARLQMRRDARLDTLARQEQWHTAPLEALARALRERDPRRASVQLACGTLRLRKQQPQWTYSGEPRDDETPEEAGEREFCVWAAAHRPELVNPVPVGFRVAVPNLRAVFDTLEGMRSTGLVLDPRTDRARPDKNAVKQALVLRSDDGKRVLAHGVEPETKERPPGLSVDEQPHTFVVELPEED